MSVRAIHQGLRVVSRALVGAVCLATGACAGSRSRPAGSPLPGSASAADLQQVVRTRLDSLQAETALYAKDLRTGRELAVRADQPVNTVSVIKLAIMVLAYRDSEAGRLPLDERHTIRPEEMRAGSGVLQTFAPKLSPTYRDLVAQMIITSDNTATDIVIGKVGLHRVNELLDSLARSSIAAFRPTLPRLNGIATTCETRRGGWVARRRGRSDACWSSSSRGSWRPVPRRPRCGRSS